MLNHILLFIYLFIYFRLNQSKKRKGEKLQRQRLLSLYPKVEHSKLETQDVDLNKRDEVQLKHWSTFGPKHSEHPLLHAIDLFYWSQVIEKIIWRWKEQINK